MVDTSGVRAGLITYAEPDADVEVRHIVNVARVLLDAIDDLQKQLAEAKANAVPWRDMNVIPEIGRVIIFRQGNAVYKTVLNLRFGILQFPNEVHWNKDRAVRWCYESDILPAAPAKAVANG